jgi:hypothetical protein
MPAPEKTYDAEFYEIEPPVIPVKFTRPKGKGNPGPISMKGFEGFEVIRGGSGRGKYRVMKSGYFTLKVLGDGYAEVPATDANREKLKILSKPMIEKATYDRSVSRDLDDPNKFWFKDKNGVRKILNKKALENGDIRKISLEKEIPPNVTPLNGKRKFDMSKVKDAELCERVRPWLLEFVKVPGALMEAAAI